MYALFELDEHYDMALYEVANPNNPTEKHIAVGFDYSLLDDFLNAWKKKKEDLTSDKITKEEYFEWKINWPHAENSFRFHLAMDTLAFGYILPTTGRIWDFNS